MFPSHEPSPHLSPELQGAERRFHEQLAADPEGAIADYQERFGNVIDRDNVRELFLEYATSMEARQVLSAATYRPAGLLVDRMYDQEVVKRDPSGGNVVAFNAGGRCGQKHRLYGQSTGCADRHGRDAIGLRAK